ncbi:MAG TPA: ribosomal protein S18-alanine N-acetyltransferase [Rhizomicrobium sp.]|jgi:ribosomal-protein-alanine N-acetyltransferase
MIREAAHRDLSRLEAIHRTGFAEPWDAVGLGQLLESRQVFAFLEEGPTADGGFVMARVAAGEAEILTIAVTPASRRKGVGRVLVEAAARKAHAMGAESFFLEVAVGNQAARALYESLGFRQAGLRKAYYAGSPPQDALVLKVGLPLNLGP